VLHGDNGQGKTNLLEAIYLLATGSSPRPGFPEALVRAGTDVAHVKGTVSSAHAPVELVVEIPRKGRLRASVNGKVTRRRSESAGYVRAVLFSPDDLALIKSGPAGRRGYLDESAVLVRPAAADRQAEWERVLRQRAGLLRSSKGLARTATLDAWDEQLIQHGLEVLEDRISTLKQLAGPVRAAHEELTKGASQISLSYRLSWGDELAPGERVAEAAFRSGLAGAERRERESGLCLVGPHRDDLVIRLDDRDARTSASQGEARTIALALRLGVHQLVTELTGPPVLLLDDVVSELDPHRAEALLARLPGGQTIITTAEPPARLPLTGPARLIHVEAGHVAAS
jgi:DNA replication and repair protein RecF